jgi:hypothetical protein
MPLYRVQLKQGKRTLVEHIEAKNLTSLLAFYDYITTMKVSEVLKVEYLAPTDIIPIDDFVYNSLFKTFAKSSLSSKSKQFIFHNIKKTVNENELASKIIECLEVDNEPIGSIFATLMKE